MPNKKKPKKIFERNGIIYDSDEEIYFSMWLDELKGAGFIHTWVKNKVPIQLTEPLYNTYLQKIKLKTKEKIVEKSQLILHGSEYTYDFKIIWNKKSRNIFYQFLGENKKIICPFIATKRIQGHPVSFVETKPVFDMQNMTRLFVNNRKFLWEQQKMYINLIVPQELMADTFTPKEYLKTNKTGKVRRIHWLTHTLNDYIDGQH